MGLPDVDERLIGNCSNCGIEIDGVGVGSIFSEVLNINESTPTKVVLPVPDIPMVMMQVLFPSIDMVNIIY